ncbi:type II toxin-antitoxin system RelE/ParE family toxin [Buttiauxella sp. A111]|uniref:type II toxin-antitoxin system RelE/ParE family toxin n=1 Tax=Buttiauxella sp. A111 TaxID=2563088 RepID=UPI00161B5138|nr:type II toxin-antitoxin system RelE/ParE family toxin [Buttiauxella sp. A111]
MSAEQNGKPLTVYETARFGKALEKLPELFQMQVEDEIDKLIADPEMGERKKGDLAYLRVHKFHLNNHLALLGYCWQDTRLELYLLSLGSHENFYEMLKRQRKSDLRLIETQGR